MFCNILVSVDGSRHADRALAEAIDIASAHRSRLTIITAVRKPPGWMCASLTVPPPPTLRDDLERESCAILEAAVDRVPDTIPVTKILTHRPIRSALKQEVATGKYDLLVMGSRGLGTLTGALLGSVSHHALNHLRIPVLIVHEEKPRKAEPAHRHPATPDRASRAHLSLGTLASSVNRARSRW